MNYLFLLLAVCLFTAILIWILAGCLWCELSEFFHRTYSLFDASFIFLYFIEQLALVLLIFIYPSKNALWASIFAIIVISTASIQNLCWDSKLKRISETVNSQNQLIMQSRIRSKTLINENEKPIDRINVMKKFIKESYK